MDVEMTFREPFFGIVYADFDRNSACKITGNGKFQETIKLPLKGCGTLQVRRENARFPDANANLTFFPRAAPGSRIHEQHRGSLPSGAGDRRR